MLMLLLLREFVSVVHRNLFKSQSLFDFRWASHQRRSVPAFHFRMSHTKTRTTARRPRTKRCAMNRKRKRKSTHFGFAPFDGKRINVDIGTTGRWEKNVEYTKYRSRLSAISVVYGLNLANVHTRHCRRDHWRVRRPMREIIFPAWNSLIRIS